jgi:glycerol-3-phosphate acyltransferase PlsY
MSVTQALQFGSLLAGAYLLGSVPTAYLVARWRRGIDIRRFGSGNIGAANVVAAGSRWTAVIVVAFDLLKGAAPVYVAKATNVPVYEQVTVGIAAICGHNWTVFLRFSGGRGILCTLGVLTAFSPLLGAVATLLNFAWAPFKQFALGTVITLSLLPVLSWFLSGVFFIQRSTALTLGFVAILFIAVIRRITAPRTEFSSSLPMRELVTNRLLFDRDIRDRKAWLSRRVS